MLKMSSDRSGAKCHAKALFNNNRQIVLLCAPSIVSLNINVIIGLIWKLCSICRANSNCSLLPVTSLGRPKWHICSAADVF